MSEVIENMTNSGSTTPPFATQAPKKDEYIVQFFDEASGQWTSDAMTFETYQEADQYGNDIMRGEMTTFGAYRVVLVAGSQPVA